MAKGAVHGKGGCVYQRGACMVKGVCVANGGTCMTGGACVAGGMHGKRAYMTGETATAVYGTHPTGMHSCLSNKYTKPFIHS